MAGLVQRLAFPLSGRTSESAALVVNGTVQYDYGLGGMAFLSGIDEQHPMLRALAPQRKDQFDNNKEPGEQSLVGWWLRSQSTFVGGEGMLYQDPDTVNIGGLEDRHAIQYYHSVGLNPWVSDKLTMLRSTTNRISDGTSNQHFVLGWNDGTDRYWSAVGNVLKSDTGAAVTTITWGGANTIRSLTSDGTNYYAADNVGIYKGLGNGAGALVWNTGSTAVTLGWAKGRLMAAVDNKVYELVTGGPALPAAKFTHLNAAFRFTAFAEGTNAIYAAGNAGAQGAIYKFVLDSSGNVPTLASGGILTAQLPLGETVLSMVTYLGTFVGIGTSRGFRVGTIDSNGDISYGPLLVTNSAGVQAVAAYDRFFFASASNGIDGQSGLYRIDLSQPVQVNNQTAGVRFAYATDLQGHVTGTVSSVTNFGTSDRMVFAVVQQGAFLESSATLEPTGYFQTGRIRYNTQEPKLFKFMTVRTQPMQGTLTLSVTDPGGATTSIITVSEGGNATISDVALVAPANVAEWIQIRLDFARSTVSTAAGPEVNSWQLKSLPGSTRPRIFTIPFLCFDFEEDKNGQRVGYEGRTLDRLEQFEQQAQRGDAVMFQSLREDRSYLVLVEDYEFRQQHPPGTNASGYGGILTVQLRTVADSLAT
jgi:hypothetical protein